MRLVLEWLERSWKRPPTSSSLDSTSACGTKTVENTRALPESGEAVVVGSTSPREGVLFRGIAGFQRSPRCRLVRGYRIFDEPWIEVKISTTKAVRPVASEFIGWRKEPYSNACANEILLRGKINEIEWEELEVEKSAI
ncbi:hypothetical protein KM043_002769 [Ampulex compressa]|nr:hypothetical protein KM043_002769 [Ampulex compressa]